MTAPQSVIRVSCREQTTIFQVQGWGDLTHSLALRRCGEESLAAGATALHVDLRHCTYMDSTFLGTLLALLRAVEGRGQGEFVLVSPSPECCLLLHKMRLDEVFPGRTAEELPEDAWSELPGEAAGPREFQSNVAEAHLALASLPGPAGDPFRGMARLLAEDPQAGAK